MTRAFVAVPLPAVVLDAVAERTGHLQVRGGRVTKREQWHLTLQFLGDDADVEAVATALDGLSAPGGRVRLGGAGAFPGARRGSVLWIGCAEGTEVLARLAGAVAERLTPLGYEADARPFHPHLTVLRCSRPIDLRGPTAALGSEPVGPAWTVDALIVYESELRKSGARYIERATIALPGCPT